MEQNEVYKKNPKQFENENFVLYSPNSLNYITKDLEILMQRSLEKYKSIFSVEKFRKVQINYFDNIEDFRNYIYEIRGEKHSLPTYAKGTFDKGMINCYIPTDIPEDSPLYIRKKYNASHELFHIMYKELILEKENQKRITWFDEGMAQFFSGENEKEMTSDFSKWFENVLTNTKQLPNLNEISHGSGFETKEYSGYRLSLLAVKYLYEKLEEEEFKRLIHEPEKIILYGENILQEAFDYYKESRRN